MTLQTFLVFTPEQRVQVLAESEQTDFKIDPRLIDGRFVANLGDPLLVTGNLVVGVEVLVGPEYGPFWGETWLGSLPARVADTDVLFEPPSL